MSIKYVYLFANGEADGNGEMKDLLGGKGAGLAEMTNAGLAGTSRIYDHHPGVQCLLFRQVSNSPKECGTRFCPP